jgi:hypothetical protein
MLTLLSEWEIDSKGPIRTVDALRKHLVQAAAIELSTVPLYLYAAYSIKTSGYSQWSTGTSAFDTIRSVVIEEMLHLCLARNLLIAVGGHVDFYNEKFVFTYPNEMPHRYPKLVFRLEPASVEVVRDIFMQLELPMDPPPLGAYEDDEDDPVNEYHTLGQFYEAIDEGFQWLDENRAIELWDPSSADRQYSRAYWGGGGPIQVTDLTSARNAIKTIVEQGEGAKPGGSTVPIHPTDEIDPKHPEKVLTELSHYAKFQQIAETIDEIGMVWPVPKNPYPEHFDFKDADGKEVPAARLATLFDAAYSYVLRMLDVLYATPMQVQGVNEKPTQSDRYGLERMFLAAMGGMLYPIAQLLVRTPVTDKMNAAPGFRFYEFPVQEDMKTHLIGLCDALIPDFPSLGGDDGVRNLMGNLPGV